MKKSTNSFFLGWILAGCFAVLALISCQKSTKDLSAPPDTIPGKTNSQESGHLNQAKTFSSDVIIRWLNMQLDMLRVPLPAGTGSQAADRVQAYSGITAYEAVVPGMSAYQSLGGQLTAFPEMPGTEPGKAYHWAASANAALADISRRLFPTTAQANRDNMNTLEATLQAQFATETDEATLVRSIAFGKAVAARVASWAETDGSANINPPYVPTVGPGLWVPTAATPPVNPYSFQRRFLVPGSTNGVTIEPPPPYSANPSSEFFAMAKDVYDKSLALTPGQIAMAIYHRDAPGYPGGGHFVAVLSQVLTKANVSLDKAVLAYAKVGISAHDALLMCFNTKYSSKVLRPITYIRNEMGFATWSPLFGTPNHPEFPSAHSVGSSAFATGIADELGDNFEFTLHTYDYLGLPARSYNSFSEMAKEMGDSRVYAGIHYQASCDKGNKLGRDVTGNILSAINFLKE